MSTATMEPASAVDLALYRKCLIQAVENGEQPDDGKLQEVLADSGKAAEDFAADYKALVTRKILSEQLAELPLLRLQAERIESEADGIRAKASKMKAELHKKVAKLVAEHDAKVDALEQEARDHERVNGLNDMLDKIESYGDAANDLVETSDPALQAEYANLETATLYPADYQERFESAKQAASGHGMIRETVRTLDGSNTGQFRNVPRDKAYWMKYRDSYRFNEEEIAYAEDRLAEIDAAEQALRDLEREREELQGKKREQLAAIRERMLDWKNGSIA